MKTCLLLHNPFAGTKRSFPCAQWTEGMLQGMGWNVVRQESLRPGFFSEYLQQADLTNIDLIGVLGGDGTMHEVVNGFLRRDHVPAIPFALFPAGTGNAFNHDIQCLTPSDTLRRIEQGHTKYLDVFEITTPQERIFAFNILGFGLVSQINASAERLRWLGGLRYSVAALWHIFQNPRFKAHIQVDTHVWDGDFCFALVSNTIYTGKDMKMSPRAVLDDGLLDVTVVPHTSFWQLLWLFPLIFSGNHISSPLLTYTQAKQISLQADPQPLIIDGETKGATPVSIKVLPRCIKMVV
ncbi:MAG: diacylglycerol kinase family protein [Spirosomataceae bacterium]